MDTKQSFPIAGYAHCIDRIQRILEDRAAEWGVTRIERRSPEGLRVYYNGSKSYDDIGRLLLKVYEDETV